MNFLTVDTIEEARKKLLSCTGNWKIPVEQVEITQASDRILAEDIITYEDIPHFRRSTVDGYAVKSCDTQGAGESIPVLLKCLGQVEMGKIADFTLYHGECVYVPTGAMVPDEADAMVMVEYSEVFDNKTVVIYESAAVGNSIVRIGEDAHKGDILLRRGTKIHSQQIGVLAAAGITKVPVYVPLKIAIISSGDELKCPSVSPGPAEVRDVNTFALGALAKESGFQIVMSKTIADEENLLEETILDAMKKSDIVVLSGGSSQGAKDMTAKVFSQIAKPGVFTHGLALKPGKPAILGYDKESDSILAGLPGHPVSALIVFRILLSWLLRQLTFQKEPLPVVAKISCNVSGSPGRASYQPVVMRFKNSGYIAEPVFGKAGMISTLTESDGYVVIDLNKEGLKEGEDVLVFLW